MPNQIGKLELVSLGTKWRPNLPNQIGKLELVSLGTKWRVCSLNSPNQMIKLERNTEYVWHGNIPYPHNVNRASFPKYKMACRN